MDTNSGKKRILIASYELDFGGTTTSLLSLLNSIDYSFYDVDLILRRNEGDFLSQIPKEVNLLPPFYSGKRELWRSAKRLFFALFDGYIIRSALNKLWLCRYKSEFARWQHGTASQLRAAKRMSKEYDAAIGWLEVWPDAYVANCVNAKTKIGWVHTDYKNSSLDPKYDEKNFARLDYIVCVSESCAEGLKNVFPKLASKIVVIENIQSENYVRLCAEEPVNTGFSNDCLNIITVCRIDIHTKGLDRIIFAAERLKKEGYLFKWHIMGSGKDIGKLKKLIEENSVSDCVILYGMKPNPFPYVKAADVFVLASRYEGKPICVTEALILGKPVIATDFPSAREQIEDGVDGLIVDNDDYGIYEGLRRIFDERGLLKSLEKSVQARRFGNESEIEKLYSLIG